MLTGVTGPADLLLAPPQQRPTYVAADLRGLDVSHPEVARTGDGFSCGGWKVAGASLGALTASGSGDPIDGLRALCAAAWTADSAAAGSADSEARTAAEAAVRQVGLTP